MRDLPTGWRILAMPAALRYISDKDTKEKRTKSYSITSGIMGGERKGDMEEIVAARHAKKTSLLFDKTNNNR